MRNGAVKQISIAYNHQWAVIDVVFKLSLRKLSNALASVGASRVCHQLLFLFYCLSFCAYSQGEDRIFQCL